MPKNKSPYHKEAEEFLKSYFAANKTGNIYFSFGFLSSIAAEARYITKSLSTDKMEREDAIVASWFACAGVNDISASKNETGARLLQDFFDQSNYPEEHRAIVVEAIDIFYNEEYPGSKVQKTVCDAINSRFARPDFLENIALFKSEYNRLKQANEGELFFLQYYYTLFAKKRYLTEYANRKYVLQKEKNFELLSKRLHKLEEEERIALKKAERSSTDARLSNKETEEIFKIAFRNYNHLVSVADSKAALLIRVNAIIVSIIIGIALGKIEKATFLLLPSVMLLIVSTTTIILCILASRPRKNSISEKRNSRTHQAFSLGSFDLIDPQFRNLSWDSYYAQLASLLSSQKNEMIMEVYKESYNVRKVLAEKFAYLSMAYWIFLAGLSVSIGIFVVMIIKHT